MIVPPLIPGWLDPATNTAMHMSRTEDTACHITAARKLGRSFYGVKAISQLWQRRRSWLRSYCWIATRLRCAVRCCLEDQQCQCCSHVTLSAA